MYLLFFSIANKFLAMHVTCSSFFRFTAVNNQQDLHHSGQEVYNYLSNDVNKRKIRITIKQVTKFKTVCILIVILYK